MTKTTNTRADRCVDDNDVEAKDEDVDDEVEEDEEELAVESEQADHDLDIQLARQYREALADLYARWNREKRAQHGREGEELGEEEEEEEEVGEQGEDDGEGVEIEEYYIAEPLEEFEGNFFGGASSVDFRSATLGK